MKTGPDIARVASLIGDPARANILTALMSGQALTASELAQEAGVSLSTVSSHLGKLTDGGLIAMTKQGRHRYFRLADSDVAHVLETIMGLATRVGHARVRTGPKEPALRKARVCYDHLAGDMGVQLLESLRARALVAESVVEGGSVAEGNAAIRLTAAGEAFVADLGVDLEPLDGNRRPLCRECLDWSVRRHHLAGGLGAALLQRFYTLGWAARREGTRIVAFTPKGEAGFDAQFPVTQQAATG